MNLPVDAEALIQSRAAEDTEFRERLLAKPKETIEEEFGIALDENHKIQVHEETYDVTQIVLPPRNKLSEAERLEARDGAYSLEFLRKTMHNPAPPLRSSDRGTEESQSNSLNSEELAGTARTSIRRGLDFLQSAIEENGAWHCIRFNVAKPEVPRHYEKPAFISAFCVLALEHSDEPQAKALCNATKDYLASTMEYPGFWRYYLHLPQDLDSTTLCSLVIKDHPWIFLGRNVPHILANRNDDGLFLTWILDENEPDVVSTFRIEADPVVNANVIAYLGDCPETQKSKEWLESLIESDRLEGTSKWYPDSAAIYYAIARTAVQVQPAMDRVLPALADLIVELRNDEGEFRDILQTALAVSALDKIGNLERIDVELQAQRIIDSQRNDGSWPELLAFGDQTLKWGTFGQIGHGSESVTSAFCIEALERLIQTLEA